jgi:hypothetical protein
LDRRGKEGKVIKGKCLKEMVGLEPLCLDMQGNGKGIERLFLEDEI